jgi:hypothetical protein
MHSSTPAIRKNNEVFLQYLLNMQYCNRMNQSNRMMNPTPLILYLYSGGHRCTYRRLYMYSSPFEILVALLYKVAIVVLVEYFY